MAPYDEKARFDPTLLGTLRQDFGLELPEFERELPTDTSGEAIAAVADAFEVRNRRVRPDRGTDAGPHRHGDPARRGRRCAGTVTSDDDARVIEAWLEGLVQAASRTAGASATAGG